MARRAAGVAAVADALAAPDRVSRGAPRTGIETRRRRDRKDGPWDGRPLVPSVWQPSIAASRTLTDLAVVSRCELAYRWRLQHHHERARLSRAGLLPAQTRLLFVVKDNMTAPAALLSTPRATAPPAPCASRISGTCAAHPAGPGPDP